MSERPFVSILVRSHNDEPFIERTLRAIFAQKTDLKFEVVVCDDASTDRTREIAAKFPVRFFERPAGPYKPGRTCNALVRAAEGDIVVFNNADATPLDEDWLNALVRPLTEGGHESPRVFAFANQLPRPDAHVEHSHNYTLRELARRFRGEGRADRAIFGDRPSLFRELLGAARETLRDWVYLARRPKDWLAIPSAPVRRLVQRISHWRGMREGES